jgi:antitoxin (DNA-binding transcriptional repressor) of toxin-antitoxin stability system
MLTSITIEEAQASLKDLIHKLNPGQELIITENEQPIAKLISEPQKSQQRPGPGLCKGMITIIAEDEDHLKDFEEYM